MNPPILQLKKLNKVFSSHIHAVIDLDYCLEKGSICALLGPNGAGKSTAIGMICGLCIPTRGEIFFNGEKIISNHPQYHQYIGVVSQHTNLELDLTAYENMKIHALLHFMPRKTYREQISTLLNLAGIYEQRNLPVRTFSGGMKRKLQIIRGILHNPRLLILDEPTVGLDPGSREAIWKIIHALNQNGMTILFSTHYMEEAEQYAQSVAIIHKGKIIKQGTPNQLIVDLGKWCQVIYQKNDKKMRFFSSRLEAAQIINDDQAQLIIRRTSLEDVFLVLTGKELTS